MESRFSSFPTLITNRLIIRETTLDDVDEVSFLRNDKVVNQYIAQSSYASDATDFIKKVANDIELGNTISWSIQLKDNPKMIGSICLWNFKEEHNSAEVGYALHPTFHNQGIMSETLVRTLDYGFNKLKLDLIEAFTHSENASSKRLLEKHGFVLNSNRVDKDNTNNLIYEVFAS